MSIKVYVVLIIVALGLLYLSGCQTYHAFGDDCQKVFKSISE